MIEIKHWHGKEALTREMEECLKEMGMFENDGNYFIPMPVMYFMEKWKWHFVYYPPVMKDACPIIGITRFASFGAR